MAEYGKGIHEIVKKITHFFGESDFATKSQMFARQAVELAANSTLKSQATYSADSPSLFDLRKLAPGSLFRLAIGNAEVQAVGYVWYVVGLSKDNNPEIYECKQNRVNDVLDGNLRLGKGWSIQKISVSRPVFPISDATTVLGGKPTDDVFLSPIQIEVMYGTRSNKNVRKNTTTLHKLTLAPQEIPVHRDDVT